MQRNKIAQRIKSLPPVAYMLVVLIVIFSVMSPNYLTLMNFKNVLIQATPLMIVAFGQTCIVLTQGTDLSLGAQVSFVTVFTVWMALRGIPLPAAMLLAILSTTLVGVVNGMIVAKGSIPPFIATYGMQNILNSLSLLLAAGSSIYFPSFTYRIITETMIIGIPLMVWAAALVFIMVWVVLNKTRFGTNIHGLGGNREALQLAGMLMTARLNAADAAMGDSYGLQTVAAVVVGGTSMLGGEGGVLGTVVGALILTIIVNVMNLKGISSYAQGLVIGIVIIAMVLFDTYSKRRQESKAA